MRSHQWLVCSTAVDDSVIPLPSSVFLFFHSGSSGRRRSNQRCNAWASVHKVLLANNNTVFQSGSNDLWPVRSFLVSTPSVLLPTVAPWPLRTRWWPLPLWTPSQGRRTGRSVWCVGSRWCKAAEKTVCHRKQNNNNENTQTGECECELSMNYQFLATSDKIFIFIFSIWYNNLGAGVYCNFTIKKFLVGIIRFSLNKLDIIGRTC